MPSIASDLPPPPSCHRFRDTAVDFSPFTSLAELKLATGQMLPTTSARTTPSFPSLAGSILGQRFQRSAQAVASSTTSRGRPRPCIAPQNTSSSESVRTGPPASRRRRRRFSLPRIQVLPGRLPPTWENFKELSPPPYSQPRYITSEPNLPSPVADPETWEHHELSEYSILDLERETPSPRYTQCISLSLEECFRGKRLKYSFTRRHLSGETSRETLAVALPPGAQKDTVFVFSNAGHQISDDVYQDIHLIFVEKPHPLRFKRRGGDISILVVLPWNDRLTKGPCSFTISGIDGKKYKLEVDYQRSKMMSGCATFRGAGMPILDSKKRGNFTIEWEIAMPPPAEQADL